MYVKPVMEKIKIAIAEDHEIFRRSIARLLSLENDFEIILLADNGLVLLEKLKTIDVDIVLMDIRMPIMNGITATDNVRELYPQIKIIAFSQYDYESNIVKMYIHGVRSFLAKEDPPEELIRAIKIVYQGGAYMTDKSLEIIQKNLAIMNSDLQNIALKDDERVIINLILKGMTSKQIGAILHKSHRTIEDSREKLYEKLGVKNKLELVSLASCRRFN
jgi:DNA-binding NarL/FixJ family response regulator